MRSSVFASLCLAAVVAGCSVAPAEPESDTAEASQGAYATVAITAEPGGACVSACFDVQSSKDISFIAVDATSCSPTPVALSLYSVTDSGDKAPLAVTPVAHGNGKSCPNIPPAALKFDQLSGRRLVVCTAGAERADVFVKSGKTCATQAFEIEQAGQQCTPDPPAWTRDMGAGSTGDVAVDGEGNVLYARSGLSKVDAAGGVLWTFPAGDHIAVDRSGNAIVAGTFSTAVDLGFGPMAPAGSSDAFVAKLDRDGQPIWAKTFGTANGESARSIAVDADGNIAFAITGIGTIVLSPEGRERFSKPFSGALAFDAAGNLAVTGSFVGWFDVGSGQVESSGGTDAFVVKLDAEGNQLWSHFLGDATTGSQVGTSVAFDPEGNVLIVGEALISIRLFGTDYVLPTGTEYNTDAAYIAKLDPSGNLLWAQLRSFTADMNDVVSDSSGNIYVTGGDIGNVPPFRYNFIEMLDPNGAKQWSLGSLNAGEWPGLGHGTALALDTCNNLFWSFWSVEILSAGNHENHAMLGKLDR